MLRRGTSALVALALCAGATSCKLGPNYQRPEMEVPASFKCAKEASAAELQHDWWKLFGEEELIRLEAQAVKANQDLRAAMERVVEARATTRITESQLYPSLSLGFFPEKTKSSENAVSGHSKRVVDLRFLGTLSYEADIWGKARRAVESSEAQAQATADELEVVLQTLQADVAQDYFAIRSLDAQVEILVRTVQSYQQEVDLLRQQQRAGLAGAITVAQAEVQLYTTQAQQVDFQRQRNDLEHALAILLGRPPSEVTLIPNPLKASPPAVPAGLPSELLRRRPDVAQAEESLIAQNAQIGVAIAQFYPTLSLTGTSGFESTRAENLFDLHSRIWSIGAGLVAPIFTGGELSANLDLQRARYDEALANYRGRLLSAFREVEDGLTDMHLRADEGESNAKALSSAREYLRLAQLEYQQGLTAYLQVTDAERTLLSTELAGAQILNQRYSSTVFLMKALGGGWDAQGPEQDKHP